MDLNDDTLTRVKQDNPIARLPESEDPDYEQPADRLDSEEMCQLHSKRMDEYRAELDKQADNRYQMALDEDYFDNLQYTEEETRILEERGQQPTVYNVISQSVNWITGSEKRGRTDFRIQPRGKEDTAPAERKTAFMKYLSDVNRTPFHRSRAFEDQVKVGLGWLEEGVQDEDDGEPIYCRYESWRNIIFDSASVENDCSDMRYQYRPKWVDEDIAIALFPKRKEQIQRACVEHSVFDMSEMSDGDLAMDMQEMDMEGATLGTSLIQHRRRRVRLIEGWYRIPETVKRIRGSAFNGEIYDEEDQRHVDAVTHGGGVVIEKVMMRMRVCIMTAGDMLWEGPSPYRHNRFKFIPLWGNRRGRDGLPYGVIRGMRPVQDGVNKRASKALYILSTNKVIMDEGALPEGVTIDDFAEEVAKPDAILVKRNGYELDLNVDTSLAAPHLEMMSRDIQFMQTASGVTDELMGRTTNASSGIAIQRRQEQGGLATSKYFDNLRFAEQLRGEIELSLIEQYATEEKQFRITNMRGAPEFVQINDGLPENDITRTKADFVIGEQEWRTTMREASAQMLSDMIAKMPPQVGLALLDIAVDMMDIPQREEAVKRIRQINGQSDPDQQEPTPEQIATAQANAEAQALQKRLMEAEAALKEAQADKARFDAEKSQAGAIKDRLDATKGAMESAVMTLQAPTVAKVADALLHNAGWPNPAMQGIAPNGMNQQQPAPMMPAQAVSPEAVQPAPPPMEGMQP